MKSLTMFYRRARQVRERSASHEDRLLELESWRWRASSAIFLTRSLSHATTRQPRQKAEHPISAAPNWLPITIVQVIVPQGWLHVEQDSNHAAAGVRAGSVESGFIRTSSGDSVH